MERCSVDCGCTVTWDEYYTANGTDETGVLNWLLVAKRLVKNIIKEKLKPILDKHFSLHEEKEDTLDYYIPGEKLGLKIYVENGTPEYGNTSVTVAVYYEVYDIMSGTKLNAAHARIIVNVEKIDRYHYEYSISGFINYIEKENTLILCYPSNDNNTAKGFFIIDNTINNRQILIASQYNFTSNSTLVRYIDDAMKCSTDFANHSVTMNGKIYMSNIPVIKNGCIVDMIQSLKFIWCDEFKTNTYYRDATGGKIRVEGVYYEQIYGPFWIKKEE